MTQTCAQPNANASVITPATPPPTEYLGEVTSPTLVVVDVSIDADGSVVGTRIYKSSGSDKLDKAAMSAARSSQFSPRVVDCNPTRSNYLLHVNFAPPSPSPSPTTKQKAQR